MQAKLPPFAAVLKGRAVEDPVNLWIHRPLAYALVALLYRTRITPNQITLMSLIVGVGAVPCFILGGPERMLIGGILLWSSAILDGADGILARAKGLQSDAGRAIDGIADAIVAVSTVAAAFYHIWDKHHDTTQLACMPFALLTAFVHVYSYDFYKESYLYRTKLEWNGHPERPSDIRARLARLIATHAPWVDIRATRVYLDQQAAEAAFVKLTNPAALRSHLTFPVSAESVRIFERWNAIPMKLWAANSLAPHSYLMAICAMADRLDLYLFFRVFVANALFIVTLLWQRVATQRTEREMADAGLRPWPSETLATSNG